MHLVMVKVTARCTQCGSKEFGGDNNRRDYQVDEEETNYGGTRHYGTETFVCPTCSGECNLDECTPSNPCERCAVETVHNRCGSSVPSNN